MWKINIPADIKYKDYEQLKCPEDNSKGALMQILPDLNLNPCIIYHQCSLNLYNASKRQALYVQKPEPDFVEEFNRWNLKIWDTEIRPFLEDFDYSTNHWYNSLTASQQKEVDPYRMGAEIPFKNVFNMFCKLEKQELSYNDGSFDWPKNRCICAPEAYIKWVTGPVVTELQKRYAENKVFGYCVDKNWDDLAQFYNMCANKGLTMTVQGDISGLDRSVTKFLLDINRLSYKYVTKKVYHCDPRLWDFFLCEDETIIKSSFFEKNNSKFYNKYNVKNTQGYFKVQGTRKSGEYPTTHGNTELVSRLIRYVMEYKLGYSKETYEMLVKGDDFVIFISPTDQERIKEAFKDVFETKGINPDGKCQWRSGTALKFLKFGAIYDTDFCSTETFYCKDCQTHRVTRKLQRFYTLSAYSRSTLAMSKEEIDNYKNSIRISNLKWCKHLSLFECYNDKYGDTTHKLKLKKGKKKTQLPLEERFHGKIEENYDDMDNYKTEVLQVSNMNTSELRDNFWKNIVTKDMSSPKQCCDKWHREICKKKFNWSDDEIDIIINSIRCNKDCSELLKRGFNHYDKVYTPTFDY